MHRGTFLRKRHIAVLIALLSVMLCACGNSGAAPGRLYTGEELVSDEKVIDAVRSALVGHSSEITVKFYSEEDLSESLTDMADKLMEAAMAVTDDPVCGDYIRYQTGGYSMTGSSMAEDDAYRCEIAVSPVYYMYIAQEEEVTEKFEEVMSGFSFDEGTSDREKIREIYDWVCANIKYDKVHEGNEYHTLRSTAYGGLIWRSATCQGFCVTLYRMLKSAGIDCRVVSGYIANENGDQVYHAWNTVALDGETLLLDATWDAGSQEYRYFLTEPER